MNLIDIERINSATLHKLRETPGKVDLWEDKFFGFYLVDLFECPPFVMFTTNDCPRAWNILGERYFEPTSMKIWCRLAPLASGIFDIGAQVGVYSLAAASLRPHLQIQAFEPNPYAYARLRMHKTVNEFDNIVENRCALSNTDGYMKFSWFRKKSLQISSGGAIGERDPADSDTIVAEVHRLDGLEAAGTIGDHGLIKIDVEGGEVGTLRGMPSVLAKRPDILLETFSEQACDIINDMILPLGYRVYIVRERAGLIEPADRLTPRSVKEEDFNQFLTTRPDAAIRELLS